MISRKVEKILEDENKLSEFVKKHSSLNIDMDFLEFSYPVSI